MKPARKIKFLSILLLLLCSACGGDKTIETEKLAKLYVDLLVTEDFYAETDSMKFKRKEVFEKYSITEELYDSTFKNFGHDRERWDEFFELAKSYLDSLKVLEKAGKLKSLL